MHPTFPTALEEFLVAVLCVWRVTHLFAVEQGPFRLVARLRTSAGNGFFGELLDCFYCLSLWIALPLAAYQGETWAQRLLLWPALSGAACLLEEATKRPEFGVFEDPKESEHRK